MRYCVILLGLFFSGTSLATESVRQEEERILKNIQVEKNLLIANETYITKESTILELNRTTRDRMAEIEGKRDETKTRLSSEIKAAGDRINFIDKMFSRKAKFYSCLENFLQQKGHIFLSECIRLTGVKLEASDETEVKKWNDTLGLPSKDVKDRLRELNQKIERSETGIREAEAQIKKSNQRIKELEVEFGNLGTKREFVVCNSSTPTIALNEDRPGKTPTGCSFINNIKTSGKTLEEQLDEMRTHVVSSLIKGTPLNCTLREKSGDHGGVIFGLRFNPKSSGCEYRISEKAGRHEWVNEKQVFQKILGISSAGKK